MINLRINGYNMPVLFDESGVRLNKKIYDIEDIGSRWGDYSKTIRVASSPESDEIFSYYFNVNSSIQSTDENFAPDFNPNLKAPASIYVEGIPVIDGYAQLNRVTYSNEHNIVYHLTVYSSFKNFFEDIENKFLRDLDLSDLDHTYSVPNITGSWSTVNSTGGYVYPMIDYGLDNTGFWRDKDFKPAVFAKQYWDRIFNEAGYTYTSEFLNSDPFDRLIIPAEYNIELSDETIADRQFLVGRSTSNQAVDTVYRYTTSSGWSSVTDILVFNDDTGNFYNTDGVKYSTVNGVFTPSSWAGLYKFKGKIKGKLKYTGSNIKANDFDAACNIGVVLYDNLNSVGSVVSNIQLRDLNFTTGGTLNTNEESSSVTAYFETPPIRVTKNHSVFLVPFYPYLTGRYSNLPGLKVSGFFDFILETGSEFGGVLAETTTAISETIAMSQTAPEDYKQKDYIKSIIEMFNLYVEVDEDDPQNLIIEPRDDFFSDEKVDITELIDVGREQEIEPMSLLKGNRYEWSYQEDNDHENKVYKYMWQEDYGMYRKDVLNDFLYETKKISIGFAPTPLINYPKNSHQGGDDRIISAIKFEDALTGKNKSKQKPRILYWGGLITTNDPFRLIPTDGTAVPFWIINSYPYAGHLDNPYTPTIDICFGTPRSVFYDNVIGGIGDLEYTDANLYNVYWRRWIEEITDKESKVLTCYVKLNPIDYYNLDFRKLYFIKDATYRLLEVMDYDLQGGSTTKCKFLKWNPKQQHFVNRGAFNGGRGTIGGGDDPIPGFMRVLTGNKLDRYADSVNIGNGGEEFQYFKGFVYGENNIGGNVKASIFNSNNNEVRGDNAFLVNTDGRIVQGDEAWINNIFVEKYAEIVLDSDQIADTFSSYLDLLPELPSNQYYQINKVVSFYDYNGTPYAFGGQFVLATTTTNSTLATGTNAIAGAADKYLLWTLSTNPLDFGEGVSIINNVEDAEAGGDLTIKIYYQIIEF